LEAVLSAIDVVTLGIAKAFTRKTALGQGAVSIPGPPGQNAYQLAVQQGFTGTLDDWLSSLKADIKSITNAEIQQILNSL
jgi:hypothetical protein